MFCFCHSIFFLSFLVLLSFFSLHFYFNDFMNYVHYFNSFDCYSRNFVETYKCLNLFRKRKKILINTGSFEHLKSYPHLAYLFCCILILFLSPGGITILVLVILYSCDLFKFYYISPFFTLLLLLHFLLLLLLLCISLHSSWIIFILCKTMYSLVLERIVLERHFLFY